MRIFGFDIGGIGQVLLPLRLALTALFLLTAAATPTLAQGDGASPLILEFKQELEKLKKSYPELDKKIKDSAGRIKDLTDPNKARQEIDALKATIGGMLGAVADNGTVSELGARTLSRAREKLKSIEQDDRFTPEQKQRLVDLWRRLLAETEAAASDLDNARKEFSDLLRTLQTREDYIHELLEAAQVAEAIKILRELTNEIRDASDILKSIIGRMTLPGV